VNPKAKHASLLEFTSKNALKLAFLYKLSKNFIFTPNFFSKK